MFSFKVLVIFVRSIEIKYLVLGRIKSIICIMKTDCPNIKRLLTEREVCMEKYQTEFLIVRTERSEVRAKMTKVRYFYIYRLNKRD